MNTVAPTHEALPFPGFWRFVWMFWMQPVSLHRLLRGCGIEPDNRFFKLWRLRTSNPFAHRYLVHSAGMLFGLMPVLIFVVAGAFAFTGFEVAWGKAAIFVALALAVGVVTGVVTGVALGMALGVALGMVLGMALGMALDVATGMTTGVGFGVVMGMAVSVAFSVTLGMDNGEALGMTAGVAVSVAVGLFTGVIIALPFGAPSGVAAGVNGGVAAIVAAISTWLRLPLFPLEAIGWWLVLGGRRLRYAPVLFHELSYLPFPLLKEEILDGAALPQPDLPLLRRVLSACEIAPGQRGIARRVRAELWSRELQSLADEGHWEAAAELQGNWLPGVEAAEPALLLFRHTAHQVRGALLATSVFHKRQLLDHALASLDEKNWPPQPGKLKTAYDEFRVTKLPALVAHWRRILTPLRQAAEVEAQRFLPNPFIAGNSLRPEESGDLLLRGRAPAVHELQSILADPHGGASVVLLAPRRTGKSSLLRMLPVRLPDVVSVFFDLQDNPCDSPAAFLRALDKAVQSAAERDRRLRLPRLGERADLEAAAAWFEALDAAAGNLRVLLCIDEFERLEQLWPKDHARELLQLMGLFRATIQHRRRLRLLVSGVAPFDELGSLWLDHFINARQLRLDYLSEPDSVGLLTKPVPEFPDGAIPDEVARAIFARTAGQPYLVQLFGHLLVKHLNDAERRTATLADLGPVEKRVLDQGAIYFGQCYQSPEPYHRLMLALARGETPEMSHREQQWLQRRGFLAPGGTALRVPVLAEWIRREEGLT